ncbi:E3 ubiquitin-protein ligase TRIM16-like [Coregonus clupeaformis]|uniref:E3 ubiquitin-protein ligase TRIM16-like n=1 Tax=Coregonus clupeaformis TaxID=59861 RepID=UPI001E1C7808|nr:E3 ubiquitin-protein ligase TRIM16-like [Coregonus clupeaformis]
MSYQQGTEGGAIPKERQKDGSPNKDLDETMDPDIKSVHPEIDESVSSGYLSMKSDQSMELPFRFKGPGEVPCDICSEVKAVKFCLTCTLSYCETHVRKHYTVPKLQRHTLVEVTGDLEERLCQEHHRALEVFCRTDQMLICLECSVTKHKGHDLIIEEIKQTGRQTFDGEQRQRPESVDVLPPPGKIQVLSVRSDSVSLSWGFS